MNRELMTSYRFVVLSNAVDGRENEFAQWYDTNHLPEITAITGITSGQRFRVAAAPAAARMNANNPYAYLAIYEIETDDIAAVVAALSDPSTRVRSDSVDLSRTVAWMYQELDE